MKFFGKNEPDDTWERCQKYVEEQEGIVEEYLSHPVTNDDGQERAGIIVKRLTGLGKDIEGSRVEEKKPFLDAGREVDLKYQELNNRVVICKRKVSAHVEPYMLEKQRIVDAENERLRKAAEEQRRIAEEEEREALKLAQDIRDKESAQSFREMDMKAQNRQGLADKLASEAMRPKPITVGRAGAKIHWTTTREAVIENYTEALLYYSDNPKVRELIQKLANADARAQICANGCRIVEGKELKV